ncbi:MAG: PorP/SprF family type IX secretion system membrane protein [Bacteroidales bacterium]|nr:PorP/SprF family type IX secretion system membrane protein [Bacteroidales bacterium]
MKKLIIIGILGVCSWVMLHAQSSNYSKILSQNQKITPTFTGDIDGSWRLLTNFKTVRTASFNYNYFTATYDQPLYIKNRKFGVGVHAMNDEIGGQYLSIQKAQLALAYHPMIRGNIVSVGLQAGYVNYNSNLDNELWPNQYDEVYERFDGSFDSHENIDERIAYMDVGLGVKWRRRINNLTPEVGLNVPHLNSPNVSAAGGTARLNPDLLATAGLKWNINHRWYSLSEFVYNSNQHERKLFYGEIISYVISNDFMEKSVFAGVFLNNKYNESFSITPMAGLNYNQIHLAFSYDINYSSLKEYVSVQGPFEITIAFMALSNRFNRVSLPCIRF